MKIKMKFMTYSVFILTLLLTSCDVEDGIDGPEGPAGQNGNANVVSVLLENQTINDGDTIFNVPELTQDIIDHGFVLAYVTATGIDSWEVLPLSSNQQIILEIDRIDVGEITLKAYFTQSDIRLRFVIVQGNPSTGKSNKNILNDLKTAGIDINDYQAVINYFGLNE